MRRGFLRSNLTNDKNCNVVRTSLLFMLLFFSVLGKSQTYYQITHTSGTSVVGTRNVTVSSSGPVTSFYSCGFSTQGPFWSWNSGGRWDYSFSYAVSGVRISFDLPSGGELVNMHLKVNGSDFTILPAMIAGIVSPNCGDNTLGVLSAGDINNAGNLSGISTVVLNIPGPINTLSLITTGGTGGGGTSTAVYFTAVNTSPGYTGANPQYLSVCQNSSSNPINSLLQVNDPDVGQTLTWSVTTAATNGSVTTGGTQTATGGNVTPTGFSYTPLPGFTGSDAFAIQISDGAGGTSSMTVIVTVNPAPTTITGTASVCRGLTTTLSSTPSGGTWTSGNPAVATVVAGTGVVTGVASGTANITYTLGSCITFTTVTVIAAPVVSSLSSYVASPGTAITITGNDFDASTTNNIVYFGATRATVTSASKTSLTVTVPNGASYMPIVSVENTACAFTGYSQYPFLPTYNNTGFVANTVNLDVHTDFATGNFPNSVKVGDMDGDGKTDVIGVNFNDGTAYVYRNTSSSGSVSFASAVTLTASTQAFRLSVGDIDGDGKLDIAIPNRGANTLTLYRNTSTSGSISFASAVTIATGAGPNSVVIGDVDGDGRADVVSSNTGANNISVFRNTGSVGTFSFAASVDFAVISSAYQLAIGDLDGNGVPDLAVSYNSGSSNVSVFRNTSTPGTVSMAARQDFATGTNPIFCGINDLDGDNKADILTANVIAGSISAFRNTSSVGSISFAARVDFSVGIFPNSYSIGDIDGDGKPDVCVSENASSALGVYQNISSIGTINFAPRVAFPSAAGPAGSAVADIDGDGKPDVVTSNQGANSMSVFRNKPLQPITGTLTVCPGTTTALGNATTGGTWSSSAPGIATVGTTGIVTGVALGTANITYAGTAGPTFAGNIVVVTVTVMALPSGITGTTNVCTGSTTPLSSATAGGVWSTSNAVVATVGSSSGVVSGLTPGVVNITYTVSTGCYVTTPVTVNQMPTGISGTFSVCVGLTTTLTNGYSGGSWTSSNPAVASVGAATGIVTGVAGGNATITYTLPGNCFVTQQVTVNTNPAAISGTNNVCVGGNVTLTDATPLGLFSSSSTGVATIGPGTGLVTGISAGNTNITYTVTATGCYAVMPFTVNPLPAPITGTTNVCVASSITLSDATAGGTWSSSNPGQATVIPATGVVTGVSAGTPVITYLLSTGCYVTKIITVNPLPAAITGSSTVCVGLSTMLTNTTGTGLWSSSNTAMATIGSVSGIVTGVANGTPNITYTLPTGCMITRIQTVNALPAPITGILSACPGTTTTLSDATAGGAWTSNNTAVATIGSTTGIVTGVASGVSTITYTLSTGCFITAQVTITPNPSAITGTTTICVRSSITLASGTGGGTWSSSNPALATVGSSTGIVTGVASGNPVITYTLGTGCIATAVQTVNPLPSDITFPGQNIINLFAGNGGGYSGDGGLATSAGVSGPVGLTVDANGNVYVAANSDNRVRKITPIGIISTIAGNGTFGFSGDGGPATVAALNDIWGTAVDASGNVYVADASNGRIRKISTSGIITTFAGGGGSLGDGGPATAAQLSYPTGVAVDPSGNLFIADYGSGRVRKVSTSGIITTYAGNGGYGYSGDGGAATAATFADPYTIGTDAAGNVYVGDYSNNRVRKVSTAGIITTFAGNGVYGTSGNGGPATAAQLQGVFGVTCDAYGNVFIGQYDANSVRKVNSAGIISLVAGNGSYSFSGMGGPATTAALGPIGGVAVDRVGNLYLSDWDFSRMTKVTLNPTVCVGSTITLSNSTAGGTWSSSNTALATIGSGTGVVTGVAPGLLNITYTLPTGCVSVIPVSVNGTPAGIVGTPNTCVGSAITLTNSTSGGLWSASNASATINSTSGVVTGVAAGNLFITYTLPAGCFSTIPFTVNPMPAAIGTAVTTSYTPGAYTYVVPAGVSSVNVIASGAQGGNYISGASGNGGKGGTVQGALSVTPGQQLFVFVGTQGGSNSGGAGGSSSGGGEDGGTGGTNGGGAGGGAASDVRTSIAGGATSFASLSSRVFVGGGGGGANFSCSPHLNGGVGGFPAGGNGVPSCSIAPTGGSQVSGGTATCYTSGITYCGTNGGFGSGGGSLFWGGGGGGGYYGGAGSGEASGAGGSSFAGAGTSGVSYNNGSQTGNGSVTISYFLAVTNVCVGSSVSLSNATPGGVWSSSNPAIATVGSATGLVTGVSAGSVTFSYTTAGNCSATLAFTVNPTPSANTGSNNVCVGATTTLANGLAGGTWSSSNSNVTVNSTTGVVTGVTVGTVDVSYTTPAGCFAVTPMTVNSTPAPITGLPTVCTGQTTTLSSTTAGGTWTSSNTAFATVNSTSGVVTGVAAGAVTITYSTNPGACFRTFAMTVNQTPPAIVGSSNLCIGVPTPLTDPIGGGLWTTSNANATIGSSSGIATGVTAGNITITYTLPGGCFAILPATVNLQPSPITGTFTVCETFTTTLSSSPSGGLWTSSNSSSASVGSATGVVSGLSAGTPNITYTLPGGCNSIQQVTVNPQPATITGTAVVCVASTTTLADATFGGTWSSSNTAQATVGSSSGIVTGVSAGNPVISYTLPAGCFSLRTLTVNALPTVYTVTGGGAYCSGGAGVPVGVSNSNAGFSYQLYRGTTLVGSSLSGTGGALSFGSQTVAGTYTVMATNNTTGCTVAMSGSATVVINPLPLVFNVTGGGAYCSGGSGQRIFLSGSTPFGVTYQLYIGGSTPVGSPLAGLGTLLDFGLQTTAGTYSVVATITATGCTQQMLGTPVISINPLPTPYTVTITGGGAYCAGGIGQQVGLANSDIGISYQLFNSGTPVGSPLPGTGAALNFGYQTTAGTYTVVGTNSATTCINSMTGSVTLTVNPLPTVYSVTLSGTGSYCAGGTGVSVLLSGSQTGVNYLVYLNGISTGISLTGTGSPLNFGLFTTAGTYTVVATDMATFCTTNMSGSPVLSINPLPTPFLVTGGGAYCAGGSGLPVGLNGSTIGVSYQLYDAGAIAIGGAVSGTGGTISFGTLTAASTYTVVATNVSTGCVNNMTGSATISINPLPNVFPVTGGGGYCVGGIGVPVGLATSDIGYDYQLYNGITAVGAVTPGTGAALAFGNQLVAGTYTVRSAEPITGCVSVMSGSATVTINPLPVAYNVTGGGSYCSAGTGLDVGLSNSVVGVDYELFLDGVSTGVIVPGSGTPITFGLQTSTGVYTVVATDPATSCTNNMSGSATISITALPVAYTVTGGGNYCSGSAGVHVGLSGSDLGVNYQLYRGATAVGGPLAGTGSALDYGLLTTVGTYTVVATSPSSTCVNNMTGSATISVSSLPAVYTVSSGGSYCAGGTGIAITLSNSDAGINYQLYKGGLAVGFPVGGTGALISFGSQTAAGAYTVSAVNGSGCTATMAGVSVISVDPLPSLYTVTGGGSYCIGGSGVHVGLSGSTAGIEYQLYNGGPVGTPVIGTGLPIDFGVFTATGTYSVIATNTLTSCTSTMTGFAVISTNGLPLSHLVSGGGNYCAGGTGVSVFLNGSTVGVNYQLLIGSSPIGSSQPGTGGTLDFGLQTLAGTYTVKATNATTGCTAIMSSSATVVIDPLPTVYAVTGGGNICPGGTGISVGLSNSETAVLYQLYRNGIVEGGTVSGVGTAFSFGAMTNSGIYTVEAVNSTTGCLSPMSGSTTIAYYPVPTRFTVTGGGSYCAGGSGVAVSLNGSQVGIDYQLWQGATAVGPVMSGTGSSISFGLQTTVSTYMVTATNPVTGCTDTMYGSASVMTSALPVAQTVTGGGSYCIGGSGVPVGLLTSETGISYQLYNGTAAVGAPALGTGASISFGFMTTPGVYSVIGTNVATLCSANMANNDTVSISPAPNAYAVTGGGNYCAGGAGVNVGLGNSQTGVNYELFIGSVSTGAVISGTGSAISFGLRTAAGIYTVVATNVGSSCSRTMTGSVTVAVNTLPTAYAVTGGGGYCTGGTGVSIGLSGSATGVRYQLYNGASPVGSSKNGTGAALDFGVQTAAGVYKVVATNIATLCVNDMANTVVVAINSMPAAYTVTGSATSYCAGGTGVVIYISGSQVGVNYQLMRGTTPVGIAMMGTGTPLDFGPQTVAGTYTVTANNTITGCSANMTGAASVSINALPNQYTVVGGGTYCAGGSGIHVGLSGSNVGVKYQLYNGGPVGALVSGTGSALDFGLQATTGTYTVVASNSTTGCSNNMIGAATVNTHTLPDTFAITGGGNYCVGGTGVHIGLAGSIAGTQYQLYYGTTPLGTPVVGTGLPIDFGLQTTPGTYRVEAKFTFAPYCSRMFSGSVAVSSSPLPATTFTLVSPAFCPGSSSHIVQGGSEAGISYQLFRGSSSVGAAVMGSGSTIDFGAYSVAGTYSVVATNPLTGCSANGSSTTLAVQPLPTVYSVIGGGNYCSGTTGVHIGLSGSASGVSYQVFKDATPGSIVSGTGLPIDFGLFTAAGTYTVVATNITTACTNNMAGSATITVIPSVVPSVTISNGVGDTVCSGNMVNFSAIPVNAGSGPGYQWTVNGVNVGTGITYSYVPANADVVTVQLTSSAACATPAIVNSTMAITVLPKLLPTVAVSATPGTIVCEGSIVNFTATETNGGSSPAFIWKKNGFTVGTGATLTYVPADNDVITCQLTSSYECPISRSVTSAPTTMDVNAPVTPAVTILASPGLNVTAGLPVTLSAMLGNTVPFPTYQWSINGVPVSGATLPDFTSDAFSNLDIVTCAVTSGGGCPGLTGTGTVTISVVGVGVKSISANSDIKLMPNPSKGVFVLKGSLGANSNDDIMLEVTNMLGQVVLTQNVVSHNGIIDEKIQMPANVANGMYIVNLHALGGNKVFHVVIEQ